MLAPTDKINFDFVEKLNPIDEVSYRCAKGKAVYLSVNKSRIFFLIIILQQEKEGFIKLGWQFFYKSRGFQNIRVQRTAFLKISYKIHRKIPRTK